MTILAHSRRTAAVALGAIVGLAALAGTADARWYGDGYRDNRWGGTDRYYGYYYREPPVVYATPYRGGYGYYAPPLIYDNTPGFSITIR